MALHSAGQLTGRQPHWHLHWCIAHHCGSLQHQHALAESRLTPTQGGPCVSPCKRWQGRDSGGAERPAPAESVDKAAQNQQAASCRAGRWLLVTIKPGSCPQRQCNRHSGWLKCKAGACCPSQLIMQPCASVRMVCSHWAHVAQWLRKSDTRCWLQMAAQPGLQHAAVPVVHTQNLLMSVDCIGANVANNLGRGIGTNCAPARSLQ